MDRASFQKILADRFYPALRAEAFRGSGATLRRIQEPVLHVINIQGSSYAAGFYVNLGAHLVFLPTEGGGTCVPAKQKEYQCAFRDRLDPPPTRPPGIWPYGRDASEAETIAGELLEAWKLRGHPFFARYSAFPDSFIELVKAAVTSAPHPRDGLKYARLASELGLADEAIILARNALAGVSDSATSLRGALKRFLEERRGGPTRS